jgi:hypothetical protein
MLITPNEIDATVSGINIVYIGKDWRIYGLSNGRGLLEIIDHVE